MQRKFGKNFFNLPDSDLFGVGDGIGLGRQWIEGYTNHAIM